MQPYGMTILAADPACRCQGSVGSRRDLCARSKISSKQSDFVVVACLLDDTTRHLLNAERLRLMKPTAYLINVARGPIIDELALIEVLKDERIAGAGLDVFEQEPPETSNPLLAMET